MNRFQYNISPKEVELCKMVSDLRLDLKAKRNVKSKKMLKSSTDHIIHMQGLCAELACAQFFGVKPMWKNMAGGDDGYDLVLTDGRKVQVKMRGRFGYSFLATLDESEEFDVGVIVYPKGDYADIDPHGFARIIGGWFTKDQYLKARNRADYGYGPRWELKRGAMNPMTTMQFVKGSFDVHELLQKGVEYTCHELIK